MTIKFDLIGVEAIEAKLKKVAHDVRYKGGRFALRKAAQVVRDDAKARAKRLDDPKTPADISANIVERWSGRQFKRTGDLMFRVGVMGGAGGNKPTEEFAGLPGKDTRHWRHIEFGTERAAAKPFMRPALKENIGKATDTFMTEYSKALDRAIRRAERKK